MNRMQANILSILNNTTHWITSVELSGQMNRSVRSIKMYVRSLNDAYPNLILSSKDGYKLNTGEYEKMSASLRLVDVPLNSQERIKYILKAILFSQSAVLLDANSFEEELDVSSSTLQNDLSTIKSMLMEYHLHLVTHNQNLNIEGEERDIRRLMTNILANETQENFSDLGTMKTVFPEYNLEKIRHEIEFLAQTHQVSFNTSSHFPLILHLLIMLNRLKNNCYTQNPRTVKIGDFTAVSAFVRSLAKQLSQDYNINFPDSEIDELIILFASYQNYSMQYDFVRNKYVIDTIPVIVEHTLHKASAMYNIDLEDRGYLKTLFVYIQDLYNRAKQAQYVKNPLTNSIKKKCPFIYEIAAYIAIQLQEQLNITINDNEIASLAVHVGGILERKKIEKGKFLCYFVSHEYKQFGEEFCKKVGTLYENNIVIQYYSSFDELPKKRAALLISPIIKHEELPADHLLQVLPFMNEKDIIAVGNIINNIERINKSRSLKKQLDQLFSEKLFSIGTSFETDMDVIRHVVPIMEQNEYVDSKHLQKVIEREKLSSTSFGKVAIPHSLKMDALKTGFYVLIQKKGIKWSENLVHIVLLLTVNENERVHFQDILESIADIMTTEKAIRRLITVQNFQEFMQVLKSYLPE